MRRPHQVFLMPDEYGVSIILMRQLSEHGTAQDPQIQELIAVLKFCRHAIDSLGPGAVGDDDDPGIRIFRFEPQGRLFDKRCSLLVFSSQDVGIVSSNAPHCWRYALLSGRVYPTTALVTTTFCP